MEISEIYTWIGRGILILLGLSILFGVILVLAIIRGMKELVDRGNDTAKWGERGYRFAKSKMKKADYTVVDNNNEREEK
ncbi:hypothetical protein COU17_00550 [Candidatus Kaiserbacteria bacterium CG10_big_fil_rev_8_21_14_0_10_49_17]|uniref:Uncharacterized protein n=1 Tax=Candidatus Kaiserbacteria bacterium CG10_big_fil_rev_8_21_14_0_10_49_17 TaxID=1974609 RepID=A0A2M6WFC6_9BACT|nr:MAG: hypothetical protein COU17_00550 [Candidatus Kaiserbacteria bacterium CG10_big_fil_rev_8_21_14_0_10_49_17]